MITRCYSNHSTNRHTRTPYSIWLFHYLAKREGGKRGIAMKALWKMVTWILYPWQNKERKKKKKQKKVSQRYEPWDGRVSCDWVLPSVHPEAVLAEGLRLADESTAVKTGSVPTVFIPIAGEAGPIGSGMKLASLIWPVKSIPSGARRIATDKWKSNAALKKSYFSWLS